MNKILICILTCLILTCCSNNPKPITYYKVEEFEIIQEDIYINVGSYHNFRGKVNEYKICLSNKNDTIKDKFITDYKYRFNVGDSVVYRKSDNYCRLKY